jgi:acetyl esterase/lipase
MCLDVYPLGAGTGHPVLFFVRGGGWGRYSRKLFAPVAMKLLPEKMIVVIPNHTPYPDAGYEQMTNEVAAALSWTLENIGQYGGDPKRVTILGHSSGGHLAGLVVMDSRFLTAHGHTSAEICGSVWVSSGYDLHAQYAYEEAKGGETPLMKTMVGVMGGKENFTRASPINYVRPDLPPTLILHGGADQTVPIRIASDFHAKLQGAGARSQFKEYPGRGHSEILFSALAEERPEIVADISRFVHGCLPVP